MHWIQDSRSIYLAILVIGADHQCDVLLTDNECENISYTWHGLFSPFPKEFHPCRWLYNLQTWINISKFTHLVVGSFLKVSKLCLCLALDISTWGVFKHLQFSMSSGNGPLSNPRQTLLLSAPQSCLPFTLYPLVFLAHDLTTQFPCCADPMC